MDIVLFPTERRRASGDWRQVQPRFEVAGILHHRSATEAFIAGADSAAASGLPYGLAADREPDNPHGATAIAIYGEWERSRVAGLLRSKKREKIGYVPSDYSRRLELDVPVAVELESARMFKKTAGGYFVAVTAFLLIPSMRSGFWNGREPPEWR